MPQTNKHETVWLLQILVGNEWQIDNEEQCYICLGDPEKQEECTGSFATHVHESKQKAEEDEKNLLEVWPNLVTRIVQYKAMIT